MLPIYPILFSSLRRAGFLAMSALLLTSPGCGDTDDPDTTNDRDAFKVTIKNEGILYDFVQSGVFNTPTGETTPGPIDTMESYEFSFMASPGMKLSFATMFVPSNDFFYAPDGEGIDLFQMNGMPIADGDISDQIMLWDAGTEINQALGTGANQPGMGRSLEGPDDPDDTVRLATALTGSTLPSRSNVLSATLASQKMNGAHRFTLTLTNESTSTTLNSNASVPLSPGVWVVHTRDNPLFTSGEATRATGLEKLAEEGLPTDLNTEIKGRTGITINASPGVWALSRDDNVLFTSGQSDADEGLENLAEDGKPATLATNLAAKADVIADKFSRPVGDSEDGVLTHNKMYILEFFASPGERLYLVSMFRPSNDWIIATRAEGLRLYNDSDQALTGDITSSLKVYDVGTEVDQPVGFGTDQVQNQGTRTNVGAADTNANVRALAQQSHPLKVTLQLLPKEE